MDFFQKIKKIKRNVGKRVTRNRNQEIAPDEIFLDSHNLPDFNTHQFEGRLEKPIARRTLVGVTIFFILVGLIFAGRVWYLQVHQGSLFAARSETNSLHDTQIFSDRGVIYDRNNVILAWNVDNPTNPDFALREYATTTGLSNILGYIKYPSKDSSGFYYREDYQGMDGIEKYYNDALTGQNGLKITETNALGGVISQGVINPPKAGTNLTLSIDSRVQSEMYSVIQSVATQSKFTGGAGIIMDVKTGEILAEATYPEYNSQMLSDGTDTAAINAIFQNKFNPFLDRATSGLYAPGSVVKPVMALGALDTHTIDPNKILYTTGSISLPNPYDPAHPSIFRDWQNQGPLDMRKAIQESSDVYFYEVGGGYQDQPGMGIANIDKYATMFGYGQPLAQGFFGAQKGTVPSPEWKAANFNNEPWRIGDTYHSVIGQYGWQVTPLQVVRAIAAVANYGTLLQPTILSGDTNELKSSKQINLPRSYFDVVHQGMRQSALEGTGKALNMPDLAVAAKTGTAQIGYNNDSVNSWVTGFFPYDNPRYAFVILMEHAPAGTLIGAPYAGLQVLSWMVKNTPEYTTTQ